MQKLSAGVGFWDEPEKAQSVMQQLADLQVEVDEWRGMAAKVDDLCELLDLAEMEGDESLIEEITSEAAELEAKLSGMRLALLMSGEHDRRDAIMSISAGAGGTESQDWTEMLLRMYLRWAERRGYAAEVPLKNPR